ncbi:MAG: hypothetical protein OEV00_01565 [Acidobacteriota bacterium]|nr:hypothetical protein [Acidobacteriota bacterium]MDH3783995.1 hypothetical protein [Acidobacteriota bacterium]
MTTPTGTPAPTKPASAVGNMVVARFRDGRRVKGTTQDFAPTKARFHIHPDGESSAVEIQTEELKALFFVRTYDGDPHHDNVYSFEDVKGHGRKATVTFYDGETMSGYTMGYHADKSGFFMVPVDATGNNSRVFVVNAAVKNVEMQ